MAVTRSVPRRLPSGTVMESSSVWKVARWRPPTRRRPSSRARGPVGGAVATTGALMTAAARARADAASGNAVPALWAAGRDSRGTAGWGDGDAAWRVEPGTPRASAAHSVATPTPIALTVL